MASHFQLLQIEDIRRETADCVSISFCIPPSLGSSFRFKQGQNITIRTVMGGREIRRSYSICSSPLENELRIAVKKVSGGLFSTYANDLLQKGVLLEVLPPTGAFYTELNAGQQKNYLAFAAGSGITPILSLLKTTLATEPESHFTLVYGNRHRSSIIFREELESLKNRYMRRMTVHHILSREKMDTELNQGRITAGKCGELCGKLIDLRRMDEIFLCGPGEMIFELKGWLEGEGFDARKIHFELFNPLESGAGGLSIADEDRKDHRSGDGAVLQGKNSKITVKVDGISYEFELPYDGEPILDAALEQGADLPFACKGGVCSTCRARLQEGQVEMEVNYALEKEEMAAGFILACQSHPRTERVVIDFDSK